MTTKCVIAFENNPSKVFYSGQLLKGSVTLTLPNEQKVRGIYLNITGYAYARWSEGSGRNKNTYTGKESYLNERTDFVSPNNSHDNIRLSPGKYVYYFQCQLSAELPTSFEGDHGYIRYCAIVKLDIPIWPDKEFYAKFTVIKPVNLNDDPKLRDPVIGENRKTFYPCCLLCCCESDPLMITGRVPVGGYTPGQTINVELIADNNSDRDVGIFTIQLIKDITYRVRANSSRKKRETIVIIEEELHGCYQSKNQTYRANLVVPPIPPTDNTTSNICKVIYNIRILGSVTGCHINPSVVMPIIIGSYPIVDIQPMNANTIPHPEISFNDTSAINQNTIVTEQPIGSSHQFNTPTAPSLPSPPTESELPNLESDQPAYEEAPHYDNIDENKYNPKYPVYRQATSYSSND